MSKTSSLTVSPLRIEISKISFLFENSLFDLFNSIKDCCKTFLTVEMTGFVVFGFKAKILSMILVQIDMNLTLILEFLERSGTVPHFGFFPGFTDKG